MSRLADVWRQNTAASPVLTPLLPTIPATSSVTSTNPREVVAISIRAWCCLIAVRYQARFFHLRGAFDVPGRLDKREDLTWYPMPPRDPSSARCPAGPGVRRVAAVSGSLLVVSVLHVVSDPMQHDVHAF